MNNPDAPIVARRRFFAIVLVLCAFVGTIRLVAYSVEFVRKSGQVDLLAYAMAGRSLNHNLSPYDNNGLTNPSLWDTADTKHSRFLYPPLAASIFRSLGSIDYLKTKIIWAGLDWICLAVAIVMSWRLSGTSRLGAWAAVAGVMWFAPLLAMFERGQVELILLPFILVAFILMRRRCAGRNALAGVLLVCATLFKVHLIYIVPFLLLRRRWWAAGGYLVGGIAIILFTIVINGRVALVDYLTVQMPRISIYGQADAPAAQLKPAEVERAVGQRLADDAHDPLKIDGRTYYTTYFDFGTNGTLSLYLTHAKSLFPTAARASAACYLVVGLLTAGALWRFRNVRDLTADADLLYWQIALAVVLITAPLTWVMALVWLIPVPFLIGGQWQRMTDSRGPALLGIALFGWILVALPDLATFTMLYPVIESVSVKYVAGEVIMLAALIAYLRHDRLIDQPPVNAYNERT